MPGSSKVERLGTKPIGKLLLEMSSQTTLSLLVYAIYSVIALLLLWRDQEKMAPMERLASRPYGMGDAPLKSVHLS